MAMPLLLMLVTISVSISAIELSNSSDTSRVFALSDYGNRDNLKVLYSATAGAEANDLAQKYSQLFKSTASVLQVSI